jgi:hypothetical protein
MRTALFLLAFLAIPTFAAQTVWKWVDERGVTHYSDRPLPGATRVELATHTRAPAQPETQPSAPPTDDSSSQSSESDDAAEPYQDFEIWKPAEGESIVNTGGQVTVNVRIDPEVQQGHTLSLYLDGRLVEGFPGNATSYDLTNVPRGAHRLIAVINDARGQRVQETPSVNFMVRQQSVANPPVGPALRPPPKPRGAANKPQSSQPGYAALNGERPVIDPAPNAPVRQKPARKPGPKPGG